MCSGTEASSFESASILQFAYALILHIASRSAHTRQVVRKQSKNASSTLIAIVSSMTEIVNLHKVLCLVCHAASSMSCAVKPKATLI